MKLHVKGLPAAGYDSFGEAGRRWPATGHLVEVVDQEEDPPESHPDHDGVKAPIKIGKKTLELLTTNPRIVVAPAEGIQDVAALRAELARAHARIAELEGKGGVEGEPEHTEKTGRSKSK